MKLTPEKMAAIWDDYQAGASQGEMARKHDVSAGSVVKSIRVVRRALANAQAHGEAPAQASAQAVPAKPAAPAATPAPARVRLPIAAAASPDEGADGDAPITRTELRTWASSHLRGLQKAVDDAEACGDYAQAASARRMLTQAAPVLARLTPEDPDENGETVRVSLADLRADADALRSKLHDLLARAIDPVQLAPAAPAPVGGPS